MSDQARRELELGDDQGEARGALLALAPRDAIVLVGEDPQELVEELEEEEPGRYEWSLLDDGERTRLEVRRRPDAGPRTVTGFLQGDHRRLDEIVPDVEKMAGEGAFTEARARFGEFVCGLGWHIKVEEQVLFPFFEAKTGMKSGPTTVMRSEHADIHARMQGVVDALDAKSAALVNDALGELTTLLASHNMKEERMLYPMTDRAIDTVEAQERFVRRLAKF